MNEVKAGMRVFAKLKGYPPWPAWIQCLDEDAQGKTLYNVVFYGNSSLGTLRAKDLYPYEKYKNKFGVPKKISCFNEALKEIACDVDGVVKNFDNSLFKKRPKALNKRGNISRSSMSNSDECKVDVNTPKFSKDKIPMFPGTGRNISRSGRIIKRKQFGDEFDSLVSAKAAKLTSTNDESIDDTVFHKNDWHPDLILDKERQCETASDTSVFIENLEKSPDPKVDNDINKKTIFTNKVNAMPSKLKLSDKNCKHETDLHCSEGFEVKELESIHSQSENEVAVVANIYGSQYLNAKLNNSKLTKSLDADLLEVINQKESNTANNEFGPGRSLKKNISSKLIIAKKKKQRNFRRKRLVSKFKVISPRRCEEHSPLGLQEPKIMKVEENTCSVTFDDDGKTYSQNETANSVSCEQPTILSSGVTENSLEVMTDNITSKTIFGDSESLKLNNVNIEDKSKTDNNNAAFSEKNPIIVLNKDGYNAQNMLKSVERLQIDVSEVNSQIPSERSMTLFNPDAARLQNVPIKSRPCEDLSPVVVLERLPNSVLERISSLKSTAEAEVVEVKEENTKCSKSVRSLRNFNMRKQARKSVHKFTFHKSKSMKIKSGNSLKLLNQKGKDYADTKVSMKECANMLEKSCENLQYDEVKKINVGCFRTFYYKVKVDYHKKPFYIAVSVNPPTCFRSQKSRNNWENAIKDKLFALRQKIENSQIVPHSLEKKLEINAKRQQEEYFHRRSFICERKRKRIELLKSEIHFLELHILIQQNLTISKADTEVVLQCLDEILSLDISLDVLIKHPQVIKTIMLLCNYVGFASKWKFSSEIEEDYFYESAKNICDKANAVFDKYKSLFGVSPGSSFLQCFHQKVSYFCRYTYNWQVDKILTFVPTLVYNKNGKKGFKRGLLEMILARECDPSTCYCLKRKYLSYCQPLGTSFNHFL